MSDAPRTALRISPLLIAITALFVASLVTSNIIAVKVVTIGPATVTAGVVIFPLAYLFGDVLTEVWGYAVCRTVIWTAFFANAIAVGFVALSTVLPAAPTYSDSDAFSRILGQSPRVVAASLAAYLCGEFLNSFVLAKMKIWTRGRFLWSRTIGSTIAGQAVDTAIFVTLAFSGILPGALILTIIRDQWIIKVLYEILATPLTYAVVTLCKRVDGVDVYDRDTSFSPIPLLTRRRRTVQSSRS